MNDEVKPGGGGGGGGGFLDGARSCREWSGSGAVTQDWRGSRGKDMGAKTEWGLPLCSQQMPECDSQLANNRAGEAEGKRHSWGVRPSDRGAEGGRAGPSWDTRGVRRGVGVADG